jgi:NAD(P)-dependent dehydrogenase (short-subunit alcohol dehydrogenase family)
VRVNAVAPGWIASSGMDTYPEIHEDHDPLLKDHVPLQRIGSESEVAVRHRLSCSRRGQLYQRQHHPHRRRRQSGHPRLDPGQGEKQRIL